MKHLCAIALAVLLAACFPATAGAQAAGDVRQMTVERLPDLNVPRSAHVLAYVGGELTVIGGHTTGFVPTATAEYYRDGAWHLVEMLFPHDYGFGVVLPTEEVLVGGGCAEAFGIGRTFGVEFYSPRTHDFAPLPILERRRTRASAARLSDGTLVVAGNWHAEDAVETYSPESGGKKLRDPAQQRVRPFILQSASDNALILSSSGAQGDTLSVVVDRLRGEPFAVPLLQEWEHLSLLDYQQISQFFIGDETVGGYAWLLPAIRKADGRPGLIKVVGEDFSLLETERPLLAEGLEGEVLDPYLILLADKVQECAWLIQMIGGSSRLYVTRVGYGDALRGGKASISVYRADLPDGLPVPIEATPALLPGGRIALVGGRTGDDEYHPVAAAFILHTEPVSDKGGLPWWLALAGVLLGGGVVSLLGRRLSKQADDGILRQAQDDRPSFAGLTGGSPTLLSRIFTLMEKEELWRQKGLRVSDLATRLATNATYISACINGQAGKSFPEFLNDYRLRHAQKLLVEQPDRLLSDIADECGFSNEQSFFRCFKARTGITPQEWKAQQGD
jgi:AraC-like DNA-binding protein